MKKIKCNFYNLGWKSHKNSQQTDITVRALIWNLIRILFPYLDLQKSGTIYNIIIQYTDLLQTQGNAEYCFSYLKGSASLPSSFIRQNKGVCVFQWYY